LSWIDHHIEENNGAPSLFITFSCADYQWADIFALLNNQLILVGDAAFDPDSTTYRIKACNDYSHVIQEYFQARAEDFMNNFAKKVFGINHYYMRFEFAKSRGQIHAHILCIFG
jgi:hypothetical protein